MPEGNFAATLMMRPEGTPEQAALRSFVAALAVYDAVSAVTGRPEGFALKWPNDVLLHGGKLAGILLESSGAGQGLGHLAIGIGVNLKAAPDVDEVEPEALRPVSIRGETGVIVTPEEFLSFLAIAFAKHEASLTTFGFGPIRAAWLLRAARLGEVITARTGTTSHDGTFESIDGSGALVLKTAEGRMTIPAADVFF
jgi:BirA family biotin operon repressor/biotin-[acetyl-CoA-carboxylase] ligase